MTNDKIQMINESNTKLKSEKLFFDLTFLRFIWILIFGIWILSGVSFAVGTYTEDLMKIGVGARVMGMGKAFVAVADDGNAIFMNPAGLTQIKGFQFTSMYASLFEGDLPYILLSGSNSFDFGTIGAGYIGTGTGQIPSPTPTSISYFDYYDRLIFLSYGKDITNNKGEGRVLLGSNLKLFQKGFTGSVVNTGTGLDMDLGVMYVPNPNVKFGLNLQNILPTTINWSSGAKDSIPMVVKAGASTKVLNNNVLLALDADISPSRNIPAAMHLGGEWEINKNLSLRAGLDQIPSASQNISTNLTGGVGLNIKGFHLDYAYHSYADLPTSASHFVSISYMPGEIKSEYPKSESPNKEEKIISEIPKKEEIKEEKAKAEIEVVKEKEVYHYISVGDTLMRISEKYYRNAWRYMDIAKDNNIEDPDFIRAGRSLRINPKFRNPKSEQ